MPASVFQESKPRSLVVREVSNGWIVEPPLNGDYIPDSERIVFVDPVALADYVKEWATRAAGEPQGDH